MKVFTAVFNGLVFGGDAVIAAEDELSARVFIRKRLEEEGLLQKSDGNFSAELQEVDTSTPGIKRFYNGDA